jgi:hypothetical protein
VISPLLANVYLHYVYDLWVQQWRERHAHGDMIVVRYADDTIVGFQHEADARRFLDDLRARLAKFELELHPEKTRLIRFGRYAKIHWPDAETGGRKLLTSWASRISARKAWVVSSNSSGRPCANGCEPNSRRSKMRCGTACTSAQPNRDNG